MTKMPRPPRRPIGRLQMAIWLAFAIPSWLLVAVMLEAIVLSVWLDPEGQGPPYPETPDLSLGPPELLANLLVVAIPLTLAAFGFILHWKRFRSAETP